MGAIDSYLLCSIFTPLSVLDGNIRLDLKGLLSQAEFVSGRDCPLHFGAATGSRRVIGEL